MRKLQIHRPFLLGPNDTHSLDVKLTGTLSVAVPAVASTLPSNRSHMCYVADRLAVTVVQVSLWKASIAGAATT